MFIKPGDIQFPKNFIRAGEAFTTLEAPVPAPYFRRTFLLPEAAEGQLLITACGFYVDYYTTLCADRFGCIIPF